MSQLDPDVPTVLDDQMYVTNELSRILGYHPQSLMNMRSKGKGPKFIKLGKSRTSPVRYPRSWVIEWLEENDIEVVI